MRDARCSKVEKWEKCEKVLGAARPSARTNVHSDGDEHPFGRGCWVNHH